MFAVFGFRTGENMLPGSRSGQCGSAEPLQQARLLRRQARREARERPVGCLETHEASSTRIRGSEVTTKPRPAMVFRAVAARVRQAG